MNIRRVLSRVVVYGLIGLIVNVLVAWGFAAWGTVDSTREVRRADPGDPEMSWRAQPDKQLFPPGTEYESVGLGVRLLFQVQAYTSRRALPHLFMGYFGWPLPALRSCEWVYQAQVPVSEAVLPSIKLPAACAPLRVEWRKVPRRLPVTPAWPGILVNTLLYGGVAWAAGCGSSIVRRSLRFRRGLCPSCAYDLRGDHAGGCPECGWGRAAEKA